MYICIYIYIGLRLRHVFLIKPNIRHTSDSDSGINNLYGYAGCIHVPVGLILYPRHESYICMFYICIQAPVQRRSNWSLTKKMLLTNKLLRSENERARPGAHQQHLTGSPMCTAATTNRLAPATSNKFAQHGAYLSG